MASSRGRSLTSVDCQRDPCIILPDPTAYAREGDDLGGTQRPAVMTVDFGRWSQRTSAAAVTVGGCRVAVRLARRAQAGSRFRVIWTPRIVSV